MSGPTIPERVDVLVVGGGTAGCALAGSIARDTQLRVALLEAGPDFGPLAGGGWPAGLLDARRFCLTHDWAYTSANHAAQLEPAAVPRARVLGGCSAHNGCVAVVGHRRDYDAWAALGNPGWGWDDVAPAFERAKRALRVRVPDDSEVQPFQMAYLEAAVRAGHPRVADLNDPDLDAGVAPAPFNIQDGVRWNAALGYIDPVRKRANLSIVPGALVERVVLDGGRAVAVEALVAGEHRTIRAERVVLAAGAYGSPAILLRSGIGAPEQLAALGAPVAHALPGVGRGLTDHPLTHVELRVTERFQREMDAFQAARWLPDEQVVLLARSRACAEAFDLHMPAYTSQDPVTGAWTYLISVAQFATVSSGALTLASLDPSAPPRIDHGYLSDPDGVDRATLLDGLELALEIAANLVEAGVVAEVALPAPRRDRADLNAHLERTVRTCYHGLGSCRMGPAGDPQAVVDAAGRVHGLDGLYVCDASIFPLSLRANTNLPAAMVAEQLAARIGALG